MKEKGEISFGVNEGPNVHLRNPMGTSESTYKTKLVKVYILPFSLSFYYDLDISSNRPDKTTDSKLKLALQRSLRSGVRIKSYMRTRFMSISTIAIGVNE